MSLLRRVKSSSSDELKPQPDRDKDRNGRDGEKDRDSGTVVLSIHQSADSEDGQTLRLKMDSLRLVPRPALTPASESALLPLQVNTELSEAVSVRRSPPLRQGQGPGPGQGQGQRVARLLLKGASVTSTAKHPDLYCSVHLLDKNGQKVASEFRSSSIKVSLPSLSLPFG